MPSIEAVEQFKTIVQGLAQEPEIRVQKGLPAEEILPPESQLDDDLADLLGGMPTAPTPTAAPEPADPVAQDLDDLFSTPVPDPEADLTGPSLDDLLGPAAPAADEEPTPGAEPDFDFGLEEPSAPADLDDEAGADTLAALSEDLGFDPGAPADDEIAGAPDEPEAPTPADDPFADLGAEVPDLGDDFAVPEASFDELTDLEESVAEAPVRSAPGRRSQEGVSPEDLDDAFFDTPGDDLFGTATPPADDDLDFGGATLDADFPELAGFADTKEEDVEAFDALQEADEFQLGDFESQFGITADDHTDAELLNPAQDVELLDEANDLNFSLSDEEFRTLQTTLTNLPLNLRLAVEELLGEKDVAADDFEKVVGLLTARAPARTIASVVGKLIGQKIVIPPGFEKGSGADLEAQHGTLWYNLRTIMLPVLRISALLSAVAAVVVVLGWMFLMKPLRANDLYDKGLVLAKQNDGAGADELFAQAWYYWPAQDRFFQYAETYMDTGDYDRARRKYLELLQPSVKPYKTEDRAVLDERFGKPLAPLPNGLEGQALTERLAVKKAALVDYYAYVERLLSSVEAGSGGPGDVPGEVVLANPDPKGILDYSRFETDFGFDGRDKEAHFRRANAILGPLLAANPGSKPGLLRKADNYLAWSKALSSKAALDQANAALSEYLRLYSYEAAVTWRFVRVFLLQDEESELLKLRDRIDLDRRMAMDGETMALLAQWLIDREEAVVQKERAVPVVQKTIEEEYGVRPKIVEPPTVEELAEKAAALAGEGTSPEGGAPAAAPAPAASHQILRSAEGGGGEAASSEGGSSEKKPPEITPPYKYPNTSEPYRPDYLDKVETLLLRAMDTQKSLPELHHQLARYYAHTKSREDERRALAAADTYFQRLPARMVRLNERPAMRVANSTRIGEIFEAEGQPLQAEKYYLDAQKAFEAYRSQGLTTMDSTAARLYRNLGNLYYRQTPGVDAAGHGTVPGGWDQAEALFETAEAAHGEDPGVSYRLGVIRYEKKDFAGAVRQFFVLDRPGDLGEVSGRTNPNLLYAMGNALFRSGNFAAAEGYYRQLLDQLRERRAKIKEFDPVVRSTHRALAQRLYEVWNNLAAAQYRAANAFRSGTPELSEALAALTTARAQTLILGRDLYEDKTEIDITRADVEAIRADEAKIVAQTRKEKGLVEANLAVLAQIEAAPPSRKAALATQLDIFARIPLELDQEAAP